MSSTELRQDLLDQGDRNREPDVVRAADDGRVDADRFPPQVEQRPAGLPGLIEASVWRKSA
jgi:hypothetical protein